MKNNFTSGIVAIPPPPRNGKSFCARVYTLCWKTLSEISRWRHWQLENLTDRKYDKKKVYMILTFCSKTVIKRNNNTPCFSAPSKPIDVQATDASNSSILLQWNPPEEPNGYLQPYNISWRVDEVDDFW